MLTSSAVCAADYAMILEFDAMVGKYIDAIQEAGVAENTVLIVTSDHGDMQMEHQQFYKMVQYDASARVPLVVRMPPGSPPALTQFVTQPTSHVDLFPTIMDLAQVPAARRPSVLQGQSLAPFLNPALPSPPSAGMERDHSISHRPFNVIQFHGCDIAMSWFSIVDRQYKYVVFGTGEQHAAQLFDILADPGEDNNVALQLPAEVKRLDGLLRSVVDYPQVAMEVATYNHASLTLWTNHTTDWKSTIAQHRWKVGFDLDPNASIAAMERYLAAPAGITPCRGSPTWPPSPTSP